MWPVTAIQLLLLQPECPVKLRVLHSRLQHCRDHQRECAQNGQLAGQVVLQVGQQCLQPAAGGYEQIRSRVGGCGTLTPGAAT